MKNNVSTSFLWPALLSTLALCAAQACGSNSERALRMNAPEDQKEQLPPLAPQNAETFAEQVYKE